METTKHHYAEILTSLFLVNLSFPLAVYAAVCAELEQPLLFPSDINSWQSYCSQSSAMMNGQFSFIEPPKTCAYSKTQ